MLRLLATAAGIGLFAAWAAGGTASRPFPHFGAGCARADFRSGGTTVRAERCGPARGSRAVIVLHGCGGFDTFDHRIAADLPRFGISTLYVDYFGPTPPPGDRGFCGGFRSGPDPFPVWDRVAADAARSLRVRFAHIGAVGWSLGAGVALTTAEDLHPFDAVVSFSGLAFGPELARVGSLPPTMFLSGGAHDIVPPADSRELYAAARRAHVATALYVYRNGTHNWPGTQGATGRRLAAQFLLKHL